MKTTRLLFAFSLLGTAPLVRAADVTTNWADNCASCHGKDGKGATKAGRTAGVKDLTEAEYQKTFTDEQAFTQIKNGLKDEKDKEKEKMKAFSEKLTDPEITALVAYLRTLKK